MEPSDAPHFVALYPFAYFDPMRRRWIRGRYRATIDEIAARHGPFRITGAPELRDLGGAEALTPGHLARGPGAGQSGDSRSCGDSASASARDGRETE